MSDTPETAPDVPASASPAKEPTYGWVKAPVTSSEPLHPLPKFQQPPFVWFLEGLAVLGVIALATAFFTPATRVPRPAAFRSQCKNNLKQIGLALHNYYDVHHMLPPAYTIDENGKPRHSWRTLISPYLDQAALYNAINFHKPWDDPANLKLFEQSNVSVFQCPSATMPRNYTTYLAIVGKDCCFQSSGTRTYSDVEDGLSNTLAVIEATPEQAVPWMSPLDAYQELVLAIEPHTKHSHQVGTHVLMGDGAVRTLPGTISRDTLRALLTIAGRETIGDW